MYVKILSSWRGVQPGKILNLPDGLANLLTRQRFAEPVKESAVTETAADSTPEPKREKKNVRNSRV